MTEQRRQLRIPFPKSPEEIKVGPGHLTKYEKSRIIGARALQLSMGAPILVEDFEDMLDPIIIAEQELINNLLPLTIRRYLPDGRFQDIPLRILPRSPFLQEEENDQK
ncbi:MAG: DNA-directed RNA polymerase subunit K [Promethearchaeota archaeon]